jgi:hypothetical protein
LTNPQHSSPPGKGLNRKAFLEECADKILPLLTDYQKTRGGKRQILYLDRSNIHMDRKNHQFDALFHDVADVEYLESFPPHHNSPLDHSLFGSFQSLFNTKLNSTEEQVREAVNSTIEKLTPQMVLAAAKDIGY